MNTKHTPGPWSMLYIHGVCIGVGVTAGPFSRVLLNTVLPEEDEFYPKEKHEIEANARLCAAAPELLEALAYAERVLSSHAIVEGICGFNPSEAIIRAKAAIKKATE